MEYPVLSEEADSRSYLREWLWNHFEVDIDYESVTEELLTPIAAIHFIPPPTCVGVPFDPMDFYIDVPLTLAEL